MSNARCKRKVAGKTATKSLTPIDVEEFRTGILDAGTRLAEVLAVEYPKTSLVDNALFAMSKIVECYGLEGRWVTSWASSARNEFLMPNEVREVSSCVALTGMTAKSCFSWFYFLDYRAGSNRLRKEVVSMPRG
jgi:hypothetical protein